MLVRLCNTHGTLFTKAPDIGTNFSESSQVVFIFVWSQVRLGLNYRVVKISLFLLLSKSVTTQII